MLDEQKAKKELQDLVKNFRNTDCSTDCDNCFFNKEFVDNTGEHCNNSEYRISLCNLLVRIHNQIEGVI
jgi:hypothetical protein